MNKRWMTAATTFGAATMVFGAAALAQTPSPGTTTTPVASVTAVGTGTAVRTGTVVATGTAQVTGTVQVVATIPVPSSVYVAGGGPFPFANPAFERVWNRTDRPVKDGRVARTYFWGPGPNTPGLLEQYNESPAGNRLRLVQYFDKSRMELNNPGGDQANPFFVTNGLLTVELISGFIQVGEKDFVNYRPACTPMSGDFGDTMAPTYFAFQKVSNTQAGDHPAPDRRGQRVMETIDRNGTVGNDPSKSVMTGTNFVQFVAETKHNIPAVFWNFLNSSGPVNNTSGQTVNEQLIVPWFFASGLPISEPYWAKATIRGQLTDVMIQAYERRALTYVPTNPAGFQVEMANIGQHYFDWRYRNAGFCPGQPVTTPTPPVPAPTGTVGTGTVVPGTPQVTGTVVSGTGTPAVTGTVPPGITTTPNPTFTAPAITTTPNPTFTGQPTGVPQPIPVTPTP